MKLLLFLFSEEGMSSNYNQDCLSFLSFSLILYYSPFLKKNGLEHVHFIIFKLTLTFPFHLAGCRMWASGLRRVRQEQRGKDGSASDHLGVFLLHRLLHVPHCPRRRGYRYLLPGMLRGHQGSQVHAGNCEYPLTTMGCYDSFTFIFMISTVFFFVLFCFW